MFTYLEVVSTYDLIAFNYSFSQAMLKNIFKLLWWWCRRPPSIFVNTRLLMNSVNVSNFLNNSHAMLNDCHLWDFLINACIFHYINSKKNANNITNIFVKRRIKEILKAISSVPEYGTVIHHIVITIHSSFSNAHTHS